MSSASRGCTTRAEEIRRISTRARGDPGCPRPPEGSHARDVTDRISGTGAILGLGRPSAPPEAAAHYGHIRGRTGEPTPAHGGPERRLGGAASLGHPCPTGAGRAAASRRVNPRKRAVPSATPGGNRNALGENRPRRARAARGRRRIRHRRRDPALRREGAWFRPVPENLMVETRESRRVDPGTD